MLRYIIYQNKYEKKDGFIQLCVTKLEELASVDSN